MIAAGRGSLACCPPPESGSLSASSPAALGFTSLSVPSCKRKCSVVLRAGAGSNGLEPSRTPCINGKSDGGCDSNGDVSVNRSDGTNLRQITMNGKSTNVVWHKCSVEKVDRQELLQQRGCVIWITGLSGSGKSTLACALSRALHARGKLTYVLDGDNVRHGLNRDLSFKTEDRAENIRRIGEVAKLFADAGVICIASLISPYRKDRDACRGLLPKGEFVEVFMDVPLQVCEARDSKGLYKLARAGKIKGIVI
ncbi:hypothetical protein RJ640_030571 [Escallonia rubra]|uniref:Adenylyl-sulfate kinase n=1 Tax=Escallonia rubra TaxID=112253 RepID=A0AA88R994_9ASTE|nr:hypothetical protein RJ640_030571 [Escallonia rubra]